MFKLERSGTYLGITAGKDNETWTCDKTWNHGFAGKIGGISAGQPCPRCEDAKTKGTYRD